MTQVDHVRPRCSTPAAARRARAALAVLAALAGLTASTPALASPLDAHPSPYLAAHADDPVEWRLWGPEALAEARRTGVPVFVSVGYFACHWCHVMQRESYRDAAIARVLNTRFVPVKVDRELNPGLDGALIAFSKATRGHAGWPLNVVLTPDGHPLLAVTYLPPEEFATLLARVDGRWREDSVALAEVAARAAKLLASARQAQPPGPPPDAESTRRLEQAFVRQAAGAADELRGGFGEGAKFPMPAQLRRLLEIHAARPPEVADPTLEAFLELTLDAMAGGGLRDTLGGGFFRYTVDPDWQVPHFEKMLYDNALLAALYLDAAVILDAPRYAAVGRDTLDFLLRSMWDGERGAFVASLSSVDGDDVEGGAYLFDEETLSHALTPEERAAAQVAFDLAGAALPGDGYLPVGPAPPDEVAAALGLGVEAAQALVASARGKLLALRNARAIPKDDKLLTGWNALALSALARGARLPDGERYAATASSVRDTLVTGAWRGNRVSRVLGPGGPARPGALEDYAYLARALLDVGPGGAETNRALAAEVARSAWARFHDGAGWRIGEEALLADQPTEAIVADGALPSASAVLVGATREAAAGLLDGELAGLAERGAGAAPESLQVTPYLYATHIGMLVGRLGPDRAARDGRLPVRR